jgi:hypothetical protein
MVLLGDLLPQHHHCLHLHKWLYLKTHNPYLYFANEHFFKNGILMQGNVYPCLPPMPFYCLPYKETVPLGLYTDFGINRLAKQTAIKNPAKAGWKYFCMPIDRNTILHFYLPKMLF